MSGRRLISRASTAATRCSCRRGMKTVDLPPYPLAVNGVIIEELESMRLVELTREETVNSLDRAMAAELMDKLNVWRDNAIVATVVMKGQKSCFCGGVDVDDLAKDPSKAQATYDTLHALWRYLADFPKPIITVAEGSISGSGLSLFTCAPYRAVEFHAAYAMHDPRFGLVPDGVTFKKLVNGFGMPVARFIALTGHPIEGHDLVQSGIATHLVHESAIEHLPNDLAGFDSKNITATHLADVLRTYAPMNGTADAPEWENDFAKTAEEIRDREDYEVETSHTMYSGDKDEAFSVFDPATFEWIQKHFATDSVEEIHQSLSAEAQSNALAQTALEGLTSGQPIALKLASRLVEMHGTKDFADLEAMELTRGVALKLATTGKEFAHVIECDKNGSVPNSTSLGQLQGVSEEAVQQFLR